jgi:hypothetical protein
VSHPKEDDIELYCLGGLSGAESARFDSHIFACPICQLRVLLEKDFIEALNSTVEVMQRPMNYVEIKILSAKAGT